MYKARKKSYYNFSADITKGRRDIFELARQKVEKPGSLENEFIKFDYIDNNCMLTAVSIDDKHLRFSSDSEFDALALYVDSSRNPHKEIFEILDETYTPKTNTNIINLRKVRDMKLLVDDTDKNEYIGRPNARLGLPDSKWKKPYSLQHFDIDTCLEKYENHIRSKADLMESLGELENKKLLCFCDIDREKCHAQILNKLMHERFSRLKAEVFLLECNMSQCFHMLLPNQTYPW